MKKATTLLASVLTVLLVGWGAALAQNTGMGFDVYSGPTLPAVCVAGQVFFKTSAPIALHGCTAANTWTANLGGGALTHATPANQTGNATATFKMNGLACTITPIISGRVMFNVTGQAVQDTTADGVTYKIAYGTGAAPTNAAAATGTVTSATQTWTALTGQLRSQFAIQTIATGLTISTAVWYDLQIADVTGGTASVVNVDCTAQEL